MKIFTEKNYKEARMIGIKAHSNQSYDEIFPYEKHLDDVADVLTRFGFSGMYTIGAYLHDAMEDDSISYNKVKTHYGKSIAEMVYCVTDERGRDRHEKKRKTLPKTASNPDAIILKLGDRIANVEHAGKIDMYASEYKEFKDALFPHSTDKALPMWEHLDNLLIKSLV